MIQGIFFDLDGTLLPMQMDVFVETYFDAAGKKMGPKGMDVRKMVQGLWKGTEAMVANDGKAPNEVRFWKTFEEVMGENVDRYRPDFDDFYNNEFIAAKAVTSPNPKVPALVKWLKEQGVPMVVATNPVFPKAAQYKRIEWAGLEPADFAHVSAYENSRYCKPNPAYYQEILDKLGWQVEETLMVGNDTVEDTAARQLGMKVFLITDCLWNPKKQDISAYPHGNFDDLKQYITQQLKEQSV